MAAFSDAVSLAPDSPNVPNAHYWRGIALAKAGDPYGAVDSLRACVALQPEHADAHYALAEMLARQGSAEDAAEHVATAAALGGLPPYPDSLTPGRQDGLLPGRRALPFCGACTAATLEHSAGNLFSFNGCGFHLYGYADPCPECGSIVQGRYVTIGWIPIMRIGRFRVRYVSNSWFRDNRFYSREVRR